MILSSKICEIFLPTSFDNNSIYPFIDVKLLENEIEINGRKFKGHLPKFKFEHNDEYVQLTETVMIPIKNKIFFIWAENHEFISEMVDVVFEIERE